MTPATAIAVTAIIILALIFGFGLGCMFTARHYQNRNEPDDKYDFHPYTRRNRPPTYPKPDPPPPASPPGTKLIKGIKPWWFE